MKTMSGDPCLHYDCTNRNSFGYCKTTACQNPKYSNIGTAQYGQGVQKRIATNADRIRAMSDEEFSHFLFGIQCAPASRPKEWLDWLKQEADI